MQPGPHRLNPLDQKRLPAFPVMPPAVSGEVAVRSRNDNEGYFRCRGTKFVPRPPRVKGAGYKEHPMRSDLSQLFRRRRGFFMGRIRYIGKSHEVGWRITGLLSVWDREIAFVETVQTVRAAHHRFGNV